MKLNYDDMKSDQSKLISRFDTEEFIPIKIILDNKRRDSVNTA
jgi:hypothetical protein